MQCGTFVSLRPMCFMGPYKKEQWALQVYGIDAVLPHDLNDSKWSQITPNDYNWSLKHIDDH